jgi:hypothetical protein
MRTSSCSTLHSPAYPARISFTLLLVLALGLLSPAWASAQTVVSLATLQVSLWPEYDQPATLVILDGQLDPATALPASLSVHIPTRAGTPHAVAVSGAGGELLTAAYTTEPAGDDIIVIFQTQSLGFRVEYYDPALTLAGDGREFAFNWQTDYPIAAAAVRVQEPVGARGLVGEPALAAVGAGPDGLNYYQADLGALRPGDTAAVRLSYAKTGATLTADALAAGAVGAGPAPVPEVVTPETDNRLPLIVGGAALGLALGAAGVAAYTRSRRAAVVPKAVRRTRRENVPARQRPSAAGFCTQCGHGLLAGDHFCRNCGARAAS